MFLAVGDTLWAYLICLNWPTVMLIHSSIGTETDDGRGRERAAGTGAADSGEWPSWKGRLDSIAGFWMIFDDLRYRRTTDHSQRSSISERQGIDST